MKYLMKLESFTDRWDDDEIKRRRDFNPKYEIGDYVCLKSNDKTVTFDNIIAKIYDVDNTDNVLPYIMKFSKGNTSWFKEEYIKRLATPEEIEEFNLQLTAIKYNIS